MLFLKANPCMDFFYSDPTIKNPEKLLKDAWKDDPLTALKTICLQRSIVSPERKYMNKDDAYFACLLWLQKHHPFTLAYNLGVLASIGCLKDLLSLLTLALKIPLKAKEHEKKHNSSGYDRYGYQPQKLHKQSEKEKSEPITKEQLRDLKKKKEIRRAKKIVNTYKTDKTYRLLHNQTSKLFAGFVATDLQFLSSGDTDKISTAALWCPSPGSPYDKSTLICEGIARTLFPREKYTEYFGLEDAHYAYRIRIRLRKEVLFPLRKALHFLGKVGLEGTQKRIFNRKDASLFWLYQQKYRQLLTCNDEQRYRMHLEIADICGKAKMKYLPHEIIATLNDGSKNAELQWQKMVEDMTKKGVFGNCLAICDVSERIKGPGC